jgi:signal transduction histidine kinase
VADEDRQSRTVLEIARILVAEQDLHSMLSRFLSCLIDVWGKAERGILLLYDPLDGRLVVQAAQGYHLSPLSQIRVALGEGMSGCAFQTGRAAIYATPEAIAEARTNLTSTTRELFQAANAGQGKALNAVCVPLIADRDPTLVQEQPPVPSKVGALVLENRRASICFAPGDLSFLQDLAQLLALSIEGSCPKQEQQATLALEEANRLKAELISTLAHEMRTPLTSIKGYSTALLMEEADFSSQTQREFLQIIDEECDVLQGLIHDLLESSAIDAGLLKLEPQPVRLPRLVQALVEDLYRRTEKHRFLVDFPAGFPIVDADPLRIEQVLRNLLDNAVKYSPQGGMIVVRGEAQESRALISVADQGVGIAPEHLNRLFEKFFRVRSVLEHHVVGSGLGLPISRTIVESHGGHIWAESRLGEGSTFYFTLPLEE